MRRLTSQQTRDRLEKRHSDFEFPNFHTEYKNTRSRITYTCSIHGNFSTTVDKLLYGSGCPKCGMIRGATSRRLSQDDILQSLKSIHGDKYRFPNTSAEYINCYSLLTGICPEHGKFRIKFHSLKYKEAGCPTCGKIAQTESKRNIPGIDCLADYERYHSQLVLTDFAHCGIRGELKVLCKKCQKSMTPTLAQVHKRIQCINSVGQGECNFYCSDKCKSECTVFYKKIYPHTDTESEYDARVKKARNCQHRDKHTLRQIQFDEFGYYFCEKCGESVPNPELHHTIEVAKDPEGAITVAGHMLVCEDCHKEFTKMCL